MTHAAQTVLETLLQLSETDREELAARLIESLDATPEEGAGAEWSEEIRARVDEVRTGQVKTIPWAVAREQIMS